MNINFTETKNGLSAVLKDKKYNLIYPEKIWKNFYLNKKAWIDNLSYLQTVCMPFVSGFRKLEYNIGAPFFRKEFSRLIRGEIPGAVESQKGMNTKKAFDIFKRSKYIFKGKKNIPSIAGKNLSHKSVNLLSLGKDSLLSLALSKEIGLNPVSVYVNDTVSSKENKYKINAIKKIGKQEDLDYLIIENQMEKLNDFETWNTGESCLGYMHMLSGFCFLSLPIAEYYKAGFIVLGNENDMDESFKNKDNVKAYPSFGQTSIWTKRQSSFLEKYYGRKVFSLIEPLRDILLFRVLHRRYPEIGKYQLSCADLDASREKRWCYHCSTCSSEIINLLANGINPRKVGFKKNMLDKRYKDYFPLFNGKKLDVYEKGENNRLESMLSFYLAYKNGARGYLIDLFKKKFLSEAKEREDELLKRFFKIHKFETVPLKLRKEIKSIYKEELNSVF